MTRTMPDPCRPPARAARLALALWLLSASGLLLLGLHLVGDFLPESSAPASPQVNAPPAVFREPFDCPGIQRPSTAPGDDAGLDDGELIIGVSMGHRSRAYLVAALSRGPTSHIINDVLDGLPVSVTYCDIHECARLFTTGVSSTPLDLWQGGLEGDTMVVKVAGHRYRQDSGAALEPDSPPLPYDSRPGDVTSWGKWLRAHPDTDVYLGLPHEPAPPVSSAQAAKPPAAPRVLPSRLPTILASFLAASGEPVLTSVAALLVVALLAYVCGPRRSDSKRAIGRWRSRVSAHVPQ
jgi:hypothetical protein